MCVFLLLLHQRGLLTALNEKVDKMPQTTSFDLQGFRHAMGFYASGITVITSTHEDLPVGFTCQSFFSLSLEPPLVCFAVQKSSLSWSKIRRSAKFAINFLASDQTELSKRFGASRDDRWAFTTWVTNDSGNPVLDGALATLDCSLHAKHETGDHWLVIARVEDVTEGQPDVCWAAPLLYYRGQYHSIKET